MHFPHIRTRVASRECRDDNDLQDDGERNVTNEFSERPGRLCATDGNSDYDDDDEEEEDGRDERV